MIPDPVFIIGTERSGSNLLRLMLHSHPAIAIPHPPHIMRDLTPFLRRYGDLTDDRNFRSLVRDVIRVVGLHFAPWPIRLDEEALVREAPSRTLYGVYTAMQEQYLRHQGKRRWGCKSTFMYRHIAEILKHHDAPRFLHLVRDPRDVAASARESIFSRYHPYKEGLLWAEQQGEIEKWGRLISEGRMLRVRYEDLVSHPEAELKRIMAFLGEGYSPGQLEFFRSREAGGLASLSESWKNCGSPVSSGSVGRYRQGLSPAEVALVELRCRPLMRAYGYEPENGGALREPPLWRRAGIELSERLKMLAAESRSFREDKNFQLRWKKWFYLQYLKASRSPAHG